MNAQEQLEAWVELRIVQRRATRAEVYALRRVRRSDTPAAHRLLTAAYIHGVWIAPAQRMAEKIVGGFRPLVAAVTELARLFAEAEAEAFAEIDLGEFDNRAHDWMR